MRADRAAVGGMSIFGVEEGLRAPDALWDPILSRLRASRLRRGWGCGRRVGATLTGPVPRLLLQPDNHRDLLRLPRSLVAKAFGGSDRGMIGVNLHV